MQSVRCVLALLSMLTRGRPIKQHSAAFLLCNNHHCRLSPCILFSSRPHTIAWSKCVSFAHSLNSITSEAVASQITRFPGSQWQAIFENIHCTHTHSEIKWKYIRKIVYSILATQVGSGSVAVWVHKCIVPWPSYHLFFSFIWNIKLKNQHWIHT